MQRTFKGGITATATMVALVAVLLAALLFVTGCASDSGNGGGDEQPYADVPADIQTLAGALDWLSENAADGGAYTVTLQANEPAQGCDLSYGDFHGIGQCAELLY